NSASMRSIEVTAVASPSIVPSMVALARGFGPEISKVHAPDGLQSTNAKPQMIDTTIGSLRKLRMYCPRNLISKLAFHFPLPAMEDMLVLCGKLEKAKT